eukprot:scaffold4635_cov195-Skeletonema_marinoi.AAC.7
MASPRMDQVFYSAHSKASHYILRHTSHRFRAIIEHAVLGLAICAFCTVILSHRAFVHREDIACISHVNGEGGVADVNGGGCSNNMSVYSILVQVVRGGYTWAVQGKNKSSSWPSNEKQVPLLCLKSIPGFREDADVNHILYQNNEGEQQSLAMVENNNGGDGSRAFTIYRGYENERLVTGYSFDQSKQQQETCVIRNSETNLQQQQQQQQKQRQRTLSERWWLGGGQRIQQQYNPCSEQMMTFLTEQGYLSIDEDANQQLTPSLQNQWNSTTKTTAITTFSPIIYSYSHSHGLLSLTPNLQHTHNVSTQFIIPSTTDENCFGEPFLKSIIFRLVGPDTVILNWILGLQHHHLGDDDVGTERPRFVYHWKAKKLIDLDIFDKDHYAFSSRSGGDDEAANTTFSSSKSINALVSKLQMHPIYRLLRFLTFRLSVLLSSLFIFFLTTSLVSFTLQETQDRMLEFTLQLKDRVRNRLPLAGLVVRHVLENLVFVPIMVGMIFFLIEYYGGDKFLAFSVLSMVWLCEVFSAISIRYASLASTVLFLFHTILFFWNRYELPALHAGLISSQSPRASPVHRGGWNNNFNNNNTNDSVGGTETTAPSTLFIPQPYPVNELGSPMRSAVAAASTSLQSIRSLASIHSLTSLAERTPNLLFHGGYNLNDSIDTDGEDDSYIARVGGSASSDFNSFHHHNS